MGINRTIEWSIGALAVARQTEATVTLTPGKHTLQLLLGDGNHIPRTPVMSKLFSIVVTKTANSGAVVAGRARPRRQVQRIEASGRHESCDLSGIRRRTGFCIF
jgi:hypothetical protein